MVALSDARHNVIWVLSVLNGLDIITMGIPIMLLTGNQAAEHIISTNGPGRNKSLTLRGTFMKDTIKKGIVTVRWITGELQVANGLTKMLNARGSTKSWEDLGVKAGWVARHWEECWRAAESCRCTSSHQTGHRVRHQHTGNLDI
ncbi:hypothetical protein NDA13_001143 [Ustilago tritici]|nr:hypothetical protein NDA13_001143 [Ustilago tritici]